MSGPEAAPTTIEWAKAVLMTATTLRDLAEGVLERKPNPDRASRLALLRSSDALAYVASVGLDGYLTDGEVAELRRDFPMFDCDHEQVMALAEPREVMKSLIASGAASPFVNMGQPKKWPAEERSDELLDALGDMMHAFGAGIVTDPDQKAALDKAHAAFAKARGDS